MQTDIDQVKVDLLALISQVQSLKQHFQQSIDSAINRENSFREAVDASFAGIQEYVQKSLEKLEKAVTDYFLRREAKWESQWKKTLALKYSHYCQAAGLHSSYLLHILSPHSKKPRCQQCQCTTT